MKYLFIVVIIFSLSIFKTGAQGFTEKENSLLEKFIKSKLAFENEKIVSDTLAKVFSGVVCKVKAGFSDESGTSYCLENIYLLNGDILVQLNSNDLLSALRSDFSIKSGADAKVLETALDKISPVRWDNEKFKEHFKKDNKWFFVRGKFFDSKSAYVVTVDQSGKITAAAYDLEAIKK